MLALGIILLLLAAALVVGVLLTGTSQDILFTSTIGDVNTTPVWVFVAGAVAMLLVLLGLSFLGRGTRRRVSRRKEMKRLRKVEKEQAAAAAGSQSAPASEATASGYDEPDRRLVREPRSADQPTATGATATGTTATGTTATGTTGTTATPAYPADDERGAGTGTGSTRAATADDSARHRLP